MKNINILIDASGSMGFMEGAGVEHENKYLLPDGSTRTQLVKKILINSIIPKLSFVENLEINSFRQEATLDSEGQKIIVNNKVLEVPKNYSCFSGKYNFEIIKNEIEKIENPKSGGTPLFWAISMILHQKNKDDFNIIVLSDGDANDKINFDEEILRQIDICKKKCTVYFIGIDQDEESQKKSKNLAEKTNGFYVNIDLVNYSEEKFESLLFSLNATIITNGLKWYNNLNQKDLYDEHIIPLTIRDDEYDKKLEAISNNVSFKNENQSSDKKSRIDDNIKVESIAEQVEFNTKSLGLIETQMQSLVKEISYLRKDKLNIEDEFVSNEDEELNKKIGYQCEQFLNSIFKTNNWEKVNWLNELNEQSKPYDFEVTVSGINYYIECKGSIKNSKEFFLTKNEWQFYLQNRNNYRLYFVSEINAANPEIIRIEDLLVDMGDGKLIPCSGVNRKVKADRILFQINK